MGWRYKKYRKCTLILSMTIYIHSAIFRNMLHLVQCCLDVYWFLYQYFSWCRPISLKVRQVCWKFHLNIFIIVKWWTKLRIRFEESTYSVKTKFYSNYYSTYCLLSLVFFCCKCLGTHPVYFIISQF